MATAHSIYIHKRARLEQFIAEHEETSQMRAGRWSAARQLLKSFSSQQCGWFFTCMQDETFTNEVNDLVDEDLKDDERPVPKISSHSEDEEEGEEVDWSSPKKPAKKRSRRS